MPKCCGNCGSPHVTDNKKYALDGMFVCASCGADLDPAKMAESGEMPKVTNYYEATKGKYCACPNCANPKVPRAHATKEGLMEDPACGAILDVRKVDEKGRARRATPEQAKAFMEAKKKAQAPKVGRR